jgi:HPt (histidine-containing phosphotransfer) domain-containing protein
MARRAVNEDEELLKQVLEAFLEEGPQLLVSMQESVIARDLKRFQRTTHTLKSGLRMFGIMSLAEDVERLELAAKNQDLPEEASGVLIAVTKRTQAIFAKLRTAGLHQLD